MSRTSYRETRALWQKLLVFSGAFIFLLFAQSEPANVNLAHP
jgi:hypothetical protein